VDALLSNLVNLIFLLCLFAAANLGLMIYLVILAHQRGKRDTRTNADGRSPATTWQR